jgi:tetratricopeptide (TPR) repeat protein
MEKTRGKQTILIYVGLVVLTVFAFEKVRKCDFVYDDRAYVLENEYVKAGLKRDSIIWVFTHSHVGNWHPLTGITHMLDCQLFGLNPAGHHLTSLLFHTANVLLLFWVLRSMTDAVWPSAFTAALFAVHPLHVESVAWVSERKDVLSGFFWILTMAAYTRYTRDCNIGRYLLVALTFCLSLMSKPMAVTLPFVLILLDYWPLKRPPKTSQKSEMASGKAGQNEPRFTDMLASKRIVEKIPLFFLAAAVSAITCLVQKKAGAFFGLKSLPVGSRIANALVSYVKYIGKMVWPTKLAVLYPHPLTNLPTLQIMLSLLVLTVATAAVIFLAARHCYLLTGWFWYLGTLVPVIGLVQVGSQAMADRYMYLPSIGINIIIAWGLADLSTSWRNRRVILAASGAVIIVALIICTRLQVRYWRDRISLYAHTVAVTKDNYLMHNSYGSALYDAGRYEEAVAQYKEAIRIEPGYFESHINLGKTILAQKKFQHAADYFRYLITLKPDHLEANEILSRILLVDMHDTQSAIKQYYRILEIKPDHIEAFNNLAWIFATTEDENLLNPDEAIKLAEKACILSKGKSAQPLDTLAAAYASSSRFREAVETAEKALKLAEDANEKSLAEEIQERLNLYKSDQPYRAK